MKKALLGMAAVLSAALVGCSSSVDSSVSQRFHPHVPNNYDVSLLTAPEGWNFTEEKGVYWRWCNGQNDCPKVMSGDSGYIRTVDMDHDKNVAIQIWSPHRTIESVYVKMNYFDESGNFIEPSNEFLKQEGFGGLIPAGSTRVVQTSWGKYNMDFHTAELVELNVYMAQYE